MQIYLARNNEQAGPYTLDQLNSMLTADQVVLTDLAWHDGMDTWQPLSQLTGGRKYYAPAQMAAPFSSAPPMSNAAATTATLATQGKTNIALAPLATIGQRILGTVIDNVLTLVSMSPLFSHLNLAAMSEQSGSMDGMAALMGNVPDMSLIVTLLLLLGIATAQTVLIIRKGQSIGKLILGTRIVDEQSGLRPNAMNTFVLRSFVVGLLYNLPVIGMFILLADFIMMLTSDQRISLHDKLAKTRVVEARPDQLPQ
jgi:uncharacterized RDD family membrane protein YckC